MPFRFIHASDLHLGRRFANIPDPGDNGVRGRLMDARHNVIARLAEVARAQGARDILLAGDTFDSSTPSQQVLTQTLHALAGHTDLHWWLLPGNHDNLLNAEPLWHQISTQASDNVHPILGGDSLEPAVGVALLPCPVTARRVGRDLTAALPDIATPAESIRIGLAHGGMLDFTDTGEQIPPDRDRSAGLDYLALGDWHGRLRVSARTHYCGTPEHDRFKHEGRGQCLAVSIDGPGAEPQVEAIETGTFLWLQRELHLQEGTPAAQALEALLPGIEQRRNTLVQVTARGLAALTEHAALHEAVARHAPGFAHFTLRAEALETLHRAEDLDQIERVGAIRQAAEALMAEAINPDRSRADRDIATAALNRLYTYTRGSAE